MPAPDALAALTAFSLDLYREVFLPVMFAVSNLTPTPFSERTPTALGAPIAPRLTLADALALGRAEPARRGWKTPVGSVGYSPRYGIHSVRFFQPGDDHEAACVGPAMLYVDGRDGRYLDDRQPWKGTAADIFVEAQFPQHSGASSACPGILISAMGLVVAALSVTGVVIWWRKRRARVLAAERRAGLERVVRAWAQGRAA